MGQKTSSPSSPLPRPRSQSPDPRSNSPTSSPRSPREYQSTAPLTLKRTLSKTCLTLEVSSRVQFIWISTVAFPYTGLCPNVLREVCEYLAEMRLLPYVAKDKVYAFDCSREKWVELFTIEEQAESLSGYTTTTFVRRNQLFVFEHKAWTCASYLVSRHKVQRLPPTTLPPRFHPGAAYYTADDSVYLFGGLAGGLVLRKCEKLSLLRLEWEELQTQMCNPRYFFTPCQHKLLVYLVGGQGSATVEIFNPLTESFWAIPQIVLPEAGCCVSCIVADQLIVASAQWVSSWSLKTREKIELRRKVQGSASTNCPPQVWGNSLYYVNVCTCFQMTLPEGNIQLHSLVFT